MANFLPRFEWNDKTVTCDILEGASVFTNVLDTSAIIVGMFTDHAIFPANTKVLSKTSTTITMSANCTVGATGIPVIFYERFDFVLPSEKQCEPVLMPTEQVSTALSGATQTMILNVIEEVELSFKFITKAEIDILKTRFYYLWAMYGKNFRYYESSDEVDFVTTALKKLDWKPTREISKGGNFLYKLPFHFRRVAL